MKKVLEQYAKHITRLMQRAHECKGGLLPGERKAVAYYTAAAETIQTLINAPTPVWVLLKFEKKLY